jgi:hypothetical protein
MKSTLLIVCIASAATYSLAALADPPAPRPYVLSSNGGNAIPLKINGKAYHLNAQFEQRRVPTTLRPDGSFLKADGKVFQHVGGGFYLGRGNDNKTPMIFRLHTTPTQG